MSVFSSPEALESTQEERTPRRGKLLADEGELIDPEAAAAVLLGRVDADETLLRDFVPELLRRQAFSSLFHVVLAPVLPPDFTYLLPQHLLLVGFHVGHVAGGTTMAGRRRAHHCRMGQPPCRAARLSLGSGLTTRGWPTALSIGASV